MCSVISRVSHSRAWGYFGTCVVFLTIAEKSNITEVIKNTANSYDPTQYVYQPGLGRELRCEVDAKGSLGRAGKIEGRA